MMRFLKAKFIIPALLVILIGIVLILFFVGALKPATLSFDNTVFDASKFTKASEAGELNKNKLIASNANYKMYFDEDTTVVTIVDNNGVEYYTAMPSSDLDDDGNHTHVYSGGKVLNNTLDEHNQPATTDIDSPNWMSNFLLYYIDKNGNEVTTPINVINNSINYQNELLNEYERHYSFYENSDEKLVQISYDIGKFASFSAYFPTQVRKEVWNDLIRGNILFSENVQAEKDTGKIVYTNEGRCFGDDVLAYLEENGLIDDYTEVDEKTQEYKIEGISDELYNSYGTHLNCEESPLVYNPFFNSAYWNFLTSTAYTAGASDSLVDEDGNPIAYYSISNLNTTTAQKLYRYLYLSHEQTVLQSDGTETKLVDEDGNYIIRGGFHARDEEGNFLYKKDDNGNYELDDDGNLIPVQGFYTLDMVEEQNGYFGVGGDTTLPVFRVVIEFKLTDFGLQATVLHDGLLDSSNWQEGDDPIYNAKCKISRIEMTPMLAASFKLGDAKGSIVIPDGCGSVIEFNNGAEARNASAYSHKIYGSDEAFLVNNLTAQTPDIMFPMFGFLSNSENKGVMAVVNKGATLTSIAADSARKATPYNYAKFTTYLRETETVNLTYGWYRYDIVKWAEQFCPTDIVYDYTFLAPEDLDYSSLAEVYRAYLCDQYGIDPDGNDNTDNTVVNLNIVGAYRHYQLTLGIIYYRKSALTSFDQAEQMIQELIDSNVGTMSVSYKGWTQDALEYKLRRNFSISSALGGKKDLQDLSKFLAEHNIDFYPELNVSTNKGYKYGFGNTKYTARGVGNIAAKEYEYDLSKLQYDKKSKPTYLVSPKFYESISQNNLKSFAKTNANGIFLTDLGNEKIGDYRKSNPVYSEANNYYQANTLKYWKDQGYKVQIRSPFDYAIASASNIVGAPLTTTLDPIVDYTIPFYQLVLSGLVDYSTEIINGSNDYSVEWYLAKAAETGSNLYFQIAYEDNSILLETDYTQYYRVHFNQWKDTIVDMTTRLNSINIHGGRLIKHESISVNGLRIAKVEYSNGVKLYINTNSRDIEYDNKTIKAYSWYVL